MLPFLVALPMAIGAPGRVAAEEGHWTFDRIPVAAIERDHGVHLTPDWASRVEQATVRVGSTGTSGVFVSSSGLVLTAHHVASLDTGKGFVALDERDERRIPGLAIDVIVDRQDVTDVVTRALSLTADPVSYFAQRQALLTDLETRAVGGRANVAQVIVLGGGYRYLLYRYHRYSDLRVVMAPDDATGYLTGAYPSPSFDFTFLRAYEDGRPARTPIYLRLSEVAPSIGQAVFISGAPYANTKRNWPAPEFEFLRDADLPLRSASIHKLLERMTAWTVVHPNHSKLADYLVASSRFIAGVMDSQLAGFRDPASTIAREAQEHRLLDAMRQAKDSQGVALLQRIREVDSQISSSRVHALLLPWGGKDDPTPWDLHDDVLPWAAYISPPTLVYATLLLREREERHVDPTRKALGFRDTDRTAEERWLFEGRCPEDTTCGAPTDPASEEVVLTAYLETLAEELSLDDPVVRAALGGKSFAQRAHEILASTRLQDPAFRRQIYEATDAQFPTLADPVLELARALRPYSLRAGAEVAGVTAELARLHEQASALCLQYLGDGCPTDTTGAVMLGYGVIEGVERSSDPDAFDDQPWSYTPAIAPLSLLFEYAKHSNPPYVLPEHWRKAQGALNLSVPLDFLSTADCVAGNSGSVTLDADGRVIGVAFSIAGGGVSFDYVSEGKLKHPARCEHVAATAIMESLRHAFAATGLLEELHSGSMAPTPNSVAGR